MVRQQNRTIAVVLAFLLVLTQTIPSLAQSDSPAPTAETPIRVGSTTSVEQRLLGEMFILLLQEAGYAVEDHTGMGDSSAARSALENNQLDLYPEYTGLALTLYNDLPVDALPNVANRVYELAKTLDEPRGITWLDVAPMNNRYALLVNSSLADEGITSVDGLAEAVRADDGAYTICLEGEFYAHPDGLLGLEEFYDLRFPEENILLMEGDEAYANLADGNCNVAQGNTTDGRIAAWDLVVLEDSLGVFHFDQPAPVMRADLVTTHPDVPEVLSPLMALLDEATMRSLNARATLGDDGVLNSGDEELIEDIALSFLTNSGLLKPAPIRVGSKEFTEQLILGKLLVLLLRDAGFEVEDMTGYGGTALLRQMLESGEIDLYPEYTGTATSVHHQIPVTALPTTATRAYVLAKSLDAPQGLVWLDHMAFNNTYTLLARQELIDDGIQSIDDLAVYMNANDAPLTICVEGEFYARPDGLDGLQALYGFAFPEENIFVVETGDVYEKLRDGECDLAEGFSTDGRINAWDFIPLEDSLAFFPFYNPAPVVRQNILDLHPELGPLLNQLSDLLDETTMSQLNAQVDIGPDGELASGDEASVEDVAYNFLRANRLVALPEIVVSATSATEGFQSIVSNMLMLVLSDAGYEPVNMTALGGSQVVRNAMLNGTVDIYVETVLTALAEYHALPVAALPTTRQRAYALAQNLDRENDIVWLDLMPYAETTAIIEGEALAERGIEALDDLALYSIANDAPITICMENEFYGSEFNGLESLQELYGFQFAPENILLMEEDNLLEGLESGECDVAAANSLDAIARGFTVLEDPLGFFLASGSAPVVRKTILDQNPDLAAVLNNLVARLDADTVGELDRLVELGADGEEDSGDEIEAYIVARDFLVDSALIAPPVEEPTSDEASPEDSSVDEAAGEASDPESGNSSDATVEESDAVDSESDTSSTPDIAPTDGEEGGETGQTPVPPDSPTLTQSSPLEDSSPVVDDEVADELAMVDGGAEISEEILTPPSDADGEPSIVVASMADTEQQLMGAMLIAMLRSAGYPVIDRTATGTSPDLRAMLESGEIDLYPEFTGVALSLYHNIPPSALPTTADGAFSLVKNLDETLNIVWIRKASFDSAYGLAVSADLATDNLRTLADMAALLQEDPTALTLCVDDDFLNDPEVGLSSLAELYEFGLSPESTVLLSADEIYRSLRDGSCDVGHVLQTDARIGAWNLVVLEDALGAFPNYSPAPVLRGQLLELYPGLDQYLSRLGPLLSPEAITTLNAQVELGSDNEPATGDELSIATVANSFLCANQLITTCETEPVAAVPTAAPITAPITASESITPVLTLIPIPSPVAVQESTLDATTDSPASEVPTDDTDDATADNTIDNTVEEAATVASVDDNREIVVDVDTLTISTPAAFGVNARAAGNAAAPVVTILPRDTTVAVVGRSADSNWLQIVTADEELAWVFTAAIISNPERIAQLPIVGSTE